MSDTNKRKRILWIHNFEKGTGKGGGWMFNQYEFIKEDVDLYFLNDLRNPISFVKHLVRLRKLSKKYLIAHAQYGSAVGFLTSLMSCKKILSLKGSDWYVAPDSGLKKRIRFITGNFMTNFSIKRFDHIIVMSDTMKSQISQRFPSVKVTKMVDPIDLDFFKPKETNTIDKTIKKVLFAAVNINSPVKRFDLAKQAFELLKEKLPNTELVLMSKIPHNEVCDFMNRMDVILLTSVYEGWPNVVKEMLACNKPFVSTRVSDLEEISFKTKNCFACDSTPEDLASGLFKALNAPNENLRQFVEPFNMIETMASLKNVYKSYL